MAYLLAAAALCGFAAHGRVGSSVRGVGFSALALGFTLPFEWYFSWGFAYAALDAWSIEAMLVAYPLVGGLLDTSYSRVCIWAGLVSILAILAYGVVRKQRWPMEPMRWKRFVNLA